MRRPDRVRPLGLVAVAVAGLVVACADPKLGPTMAKGSRPVARITVTLGGETYTLNAATRQLEFSDGSTAQLDSATTEALANVFVADLEDVPYAVEQLSEWSQWPGCDGTTECNPQYVQRADRGTSFNRDNLRLPDKARASRLQTRKGSRSSAIRSSAGVSDLRHTNGACLTARHPRARQLQSNVRQAQSVIIGPSPCKTTAISIFEENSYYKYTATPAYEASLSWLKLAASTLRDCDTDVCRARWLTEVNTASQYVTAWSDEKFSSLVRLQVASRKYGRLGCWNSTSANWVDSFGTSSFVGGGAGGPGGGGGGYGFTRTCSNEYWEISFDGGMTWEGFWAETCIIELHLS